MQNWTRITYLEMQTQRQNTVQSIEMFNKQHSQQHKLNEIHFRLLLIVNKPKLDSFDNPDYIHNNYSWVD